MPSSPRHFDVFNGDADGLCALLQLRLAQPREAELITGVKRDNALLGRVPARAGDSVSCLDLPLSVNGAALADLLARGVEVEYFDHHQGATAPHPRLSLTLDPSPTVCTSLLVNRHLAGGFAPWAVVGAFGDNLGAVARPLAAGLGLTGEATARLQELGECLNYNGYGDTEADLMVPPADLYRLMAPYPDPLVFLEKEAICQHLSRQRAADLELALAQGPRVATPRLIVVCLPDAPWARRAVGGYANRLQTAYPDRAIALLVPNARGTYTVSLRTPADGSLPAWRAARAHGGDGRATAAGINDLPPGEVDGLIATLEALIGA